LADFDVAVIGMGFAGTEAAWAAANLGLDVLLVSTTLDWKYISCSTGMGGPGRGHLLREIASLGGIIPGAADNTYFHRRPSNYSKGPAVSSLFYLVDESHFSFKLKRILEETERIHLYQGRLDDFDINNTGFRLYFADGTKFSSRALILATGTFINGKVIQGNHIEDGGRKGLYTSKKLAEKLSSLGFKFGRFRTGTPPRVKGATIDFERFERQDYSESLPFGFSCFSTPPKLKQIYSYAGNTNEKTKKEVEKYIDSTRFSVTARGPGHCPSFIDKLRFYPDKTSHRIFIFPVDLSGQEYIISGLGLYFDLEAQLKIIRTVEGLENAEIVRPGYAVEYDFIDPTQLHHTLESRQVENLYFCGQINGTSGYEEAAAQGIIAGINAALKLKGEEPFILSREEAYIGVMIDDLVTRGVEEPYRIYTSRAENRLLLRFDNADLRLTPKARKIGMISDEEWSAFKRRKKLVEEVKEKAGKLKITSLKDFQKKLWENCKDVLEYNAWIEVVARGIYDSYLKHFS
jgi:tRNA uridine 5-carboxymethylaminomethyl modification enzyme